MNVNMFSSQQTVITLYACIVVNVTVHWAFSTVDGAAVKVSSLSIITQTRCGLGIEKNAQQCSHSPGGAETTTLTPRRWWWSSHTETDRQSDTSQQCVRKLYVPKIHKLQN